MELGIYTFGDIAKDESTGKNLSPQQRISDLLEEIVLADEIGLDLFAVGEHHRPEYVVSAPEVILAAAAVKTKNIKLSSAVTVLSSADPVRVFQGFSTVDLLSNGRAEIMVGRGSFIESFPLFGHNLQDYDELFSEKLQLLLALNKSEMVSWKGNLRPSFQNRGIYPRPVNGSIPIWIAVGGTQASVVRAAQLGMPLAIAIIGGNPAQFVPLVDLYRKVWKQAGHDPEKIQLSINSHSFVGETSKQASDSFYDGYARTMGKLGIERGWPPFSRNQFDQSTTLGGALLVGDPQQVIDKILYQHDLFKHTRFLAQMDVGGINHRDLMKSIELFGTKVAPEVRKHT
ncbi:MAG: LLM class flavin-dependent oxidoreductase [Pedobacter sp.]|nr:MAG: LLM class flavin-dependent oxidoreductase [Pedobacter sp.]